MRKRLRRGVLTIVVLLLVAVGGLVGRSLWQQHQHEIDLVRTGIEFLPGVSQHIHDFHRVKVQDGRKVWEVKAQDAQYFEEDKTVVVRDAMMQLFLKDGRVVGMKGDQGTITLEGREVSRIELNGAIEMTLADYTVRTERAIYEHAKRRISAPGAVQIAGGALQLHGDRMDVDVDTQRLTLRDNVGMQLQPAAHKDGERDATS